MGFGDEVSRRKETEAESERLRSEDQRRITAANQQHEANRRIAESRANGYFREAADYLRTSRSTPLRPVIFRERAFSFLEHFFWADTYVWPILPYCLTDERQPRLLLARNVERNRLQVEFRDLPWREIYWKPKRWAIDPPENNLSSPLRYRYLGQTIDYWDGADGGAEPYIWAGWESTGSLDDPSEKIYMPLRPWLIDQIAKL